MKALFFHGGPGFNSNPERRLLVPAAAARGVSVVAWDEPSRLRPEGAAFRNDDAFGNWLESAEAFLLSHADEPVTVIGHSYGSHAVNHLCARHPTRISLALFSSPALSQASVERKMLELARDDFAEHGDPLTDEAAAALATYRGEYDDAWLRGLEVILQNPRFFGHYWKNTEPSAAYWQAFEDVGFGMDLESYQAVRGSHREVDHHDCPVPALAVLGVHDPVVDPEAELELLSRRFSRVDVVRFQGSGHYPHVEEPSRFLDVLLEASSASLEPDPA